MADRERGNGASVGAELLRGAAAGVVGTAVMTVVMTRLAPRLLPPAAQLDAFVPRRVVQRGEELAGEPDALAEEPEQRVTMGVHYGYGASMGALYGLVRPRLPRERSDALAGALFGLAVWTAGYAGWLPVFGVREGTVREPPRRWANPILSHLAFGLTVALSHRALAARAR